MTLTIGSLFAGIGGFDLGFERAGFKTIWQCEIDKAAQGVLRRHFPDAKLHSDVCQVGAHNLEPVDVVTYGSPCVDLSVAGLRAGLEGERSGLFHEAVRVIRELRERYGKPDIAIWENVIGAFSSNEGADFQAVIAALADCGALDVAWRVVNSRYWGVAQQRRRVFLVADFAGERAAEILDLASSGSWNLTQSRKARKADPRAAERGTSLDSLLSGAATSKWHKGGGPAGDECYNLVPAYVPEQASCLETTCNDYSRADGFCAMAFAAPRLMARRLTPTETERLQSFPDGWAEQGIGSDGKLRAQSDTARYKQMGNAVTVNVAEWIARRVATTLAP